MVTRQNTIILIIKLLFMSVLLNLKKVNLKYQTGKDNIRVLKDIGCKVLIVTNAAGCLNTVSYTHLTLPTILLV